MSRATPTFGDILRQLWTAAPLSQEDLTAALYGSALTRWRQVRDRWGAPLPLTSLAQVDAARGDIASAAQRYAESLELLIEQGHLATAATVLDGLAGTAASMRRAVIAARLRRG